MKLHLPLRLRSSLLLCCASVAPMVAIVTGGQAMGAYTGLDSTKLTVANLLINNSEKIESSNAAIHWDTNQLSSPLKAYIFTFSFLDTIPAGDKDSFLRLDYTVGWGLATQSPTTMKFASNQSAVVGDALTINTTDTFALTFASIDGVGYAIMSNLATGDCVELTSNEYDGITENNFDISSNANARIWTNSGTNKVSVGEIASLNGLLLGQVREVATTGTYSTAFYWKGGAGSNAWNETDTKWAGTADGSASKTFYNGLPVYFTENITATIDVAAGINPTSMTVSAGNYTFTGNSPLDNTDTLAISGGAAVFNMDIEAKSISISGAASSLSGNNVTVQTSMSMDAGSLKADALKGAGAIEITGGSLEIGSLADATGSISISGATLNGTTDLSNANLQMGDVTVDEAATVSIKNGGTLTGAIEVENGGTLTLEGAFRLTDDLITKSETVFSADGVEIGTANGNGYANGITTYTVIEGDNLSSVDATKATWSEGKRIIIEYKYEQSSTAGTVTKTGLDLSTYYVNNDADINDLTLLAETTDIKINGKTLTIDETYNKPQELSATTQGGTIKLGYNGVLNNSDISNATGALKLDGSGTYYTNHSAKLHQSDSVSLADTWEGTVEAGNVSDTALNLSPLANASSSLILGDVQAGSVQLNAAKEVFAKNLVLTSSTASTMKADTVALESLTLGNKDTATSLTIDGTLEMRGDITLGNEGSTLTATALSDTTTGLNFTITESLLDKISAETGVLTLTEAADNVEVTLNGEQSIIRDKFAYTIDWISGNTQVVITPDFNEAYYRQAATTKNGLAGATIISDMVAENEPQDTDPEGDLAGMLNSLDNMVTTNNTAAADKLMTAVAGASTAAMGAALSGDMHRQLRAIRNRTTSMGVDQCVVHHDMPYFNAWINAETNRAELDKDGTESGYSMDSWGGTVGFDVDLTPQFTVGMAFTAMYGDFTAKSEERGTGNMDTYYLSAFSRYVSKRWTHTFVASVGMAQSELKRTVSLGADSYTAEGDSNGFSLGAMYEVGYVYALDEDATACLQPVLNFTFTHSSVGGYTESGSDAALKVGDMDMTTFTIGAGARLQAAVGENMYNRTSVLEARALLKLNTGDTNCEGDVAFAALPGAKGNITSAEVGTVGLELGAGLTIPMQDDNSALFFDASAEFSSGYTNVNATAGYRYNF